MSAHKQGHIDDCNFKCLFDTYKNRLYGYVLAITHSPYAAEEITQEIFIKLWICRDLLEQVDNMDGYLFVIARHKTLNYLRKAAHDTKLLHELQGQMISEENNVEEQTIAFDYGRLLQEALTLLSPQRRLVYRLSRNNGLNYQEIASQLQLSRNTVKNHLVEALRFIRKYLGRHRSSIVLIFFLAKQLL